MTRAEELTLQWLDGLLTPEETSELAAALDADESACQACLRLVSCEIALRRTRDQFDLSEQTMQSIVRLSAEATAYGVMQRIVKLPAPAWRTAAPRDRDAAPPARGAPKTSWRNSLFALAACLALAAIGWWHWAGSHHERLASLHADTSGPKGSVQVHRAGTAFLVQGYTSINPGDWIELDTALLTTAELRLDGGRTTITLRPGARLQVVALDSQKRLTLERGVLLASVSRQPEERPMLIKTPHAEAAVLGTVFALAAYEDQTGLTVDRGLVRLTQADESVVEVAAGESAVATEGAPATRTSFPAPGGEPVASRKLDRWMKGPVEWSRDGKIDFAFDADPQQWVLCRGVRILRSGELAPPSGGALEMTHGVSAYKAVGPMFRVQRGEVLELSAEMQCRNGTRFRMQYYLYDEDGNPLKARSKNGQIHAYSPVGFDLTGDDDVFVPLKERFKISEERRIGFIALILYCYHADGNDPREGDLVVVRNLRVQRVSSGKTNSPPLKSR